MKKKKKSNSVKKQKQNHTRTRKMSAFTNLKYDECQQAQNIRESIGPGHYMINTPNAHPECKPCFYTDPNVRLQKVPLRTGETQPAYTEFAVSGTPWTYAVSGTPWPLGYMASDTLPHDAAFMLVS